MNKNDHPASHSTSLFTRRDFLRRTAVGAAFTIVPARVLAQGGGATSPNSRLNLACIGVGGRGRDNLKGVQSENIVALCDVDQVRAADAIRDHTPAKFFQDFRVMFDKLGKEIDAVVVSTPDHAHAVPVMMALKMGKHVYCEKPLAHSLYEVRQITETARSHKVATQLGNQGHSWDSSRQFCEMIWDGAIGTVREVQAWCKNSYRPKEHRVRPTEQPPVPPTLNWDVWLGPAPTRPYHPVYLPGKWRGWVDFGTGIIGDWNCHVLDPVFWALELGSPASVIAQAEEYDDPNVRAETFPAVCTLHYQFPARGSRPPVTVKWYTGTKPAPPEELGPDAKLVDIGAIVIGDKGKIMYGSHGAVSAQLIPKSKDEAYQRPPKTIPRVKGHHEDWIQACKGGKRPGSNFDYGGRLTEVALLGVLAMRMNGQKLLWDAKALKVTNDAEANHYINPPYRQGWKL
jgi:predicted dehydrogenase